MSKVEVYFAREREVQTASETRRRWEYVCEQNDGLVVVTGYCTGWEEKTKEEWIKECGFLAGMSYYDSQERRRRWKDKYHSDGHETQREACLCWREYRIDQEVIFERLKTEALRSKIPCAVCREPSFFYADFVGGGTARYCFCMVHANREALREVFPLECPPQHVIFY